jgi:hypothetical protein
LPAVIPGAAPGSLICPITRAISQVRSYYEPCDSHTQLRQDAVVFRMDAKKRVKFGLPPEVTTGRMGYYQKQSQGSSLIVRIFLSCPGQTYVDLPVDDILAGQRTGGDALQAYNHDDPSQPFGEMEYHDPAVLPGQEPLTRGGTSVTHVLAGPDETILEYGSQLLGVNLRDRA